MSTAIRSLVSWIVDRRLLEGQSRHDVLAALESVYDEGPAPVSEAIDHLSAGR